MRTFLFHIARLGFILSLFTHAATFRGMDLQKELPVIWILYFGVFLVWAPTIFLLRYEKRFWKRIPFWMKTVAAMVLLYAGFNIYLQHASETPALRTRFLSAYLMAFYFTSVCVLLPPQTRSAEKA
jgi:hypothetical protein